MKSLFDPPLNKKAPPSFRARHLLSCALLLGASACTGQIGDIAESRAGSGSGSGAGVGTGSGPSTGSGSTVAGGSGGTTMPPLGVDPGTKGVHRLNSNEYNATVADVLGTKLQPANLHWRGGEIAGFDNIATVLGVDEAQYKRYFDAAGAIANDVFANVATKSQDRHLRDHRRHAMRAGHHLRPPGCASSGARSARTRVATYVKVYTAARALGEDHEGSLKQVLRALLSSAEFLYRIEFDPNPSSLDKHPLSAFELASRLSYFLWSSAPDDALLASAADNSLTQNATLESAVDRMLDDPSQEHALRGELRRSVARRAQAAGPRGRGRRLPGLDAATGKLAHARRCTSTSPSS